jgi:ParB-like nuclease domain
MTDATNTQVAGTDGAGLENQYHSTKQVLDSEKKIKELPVHSIQTEGTQTRVTGLNQQTVDSYAEDMDDGASFPPLVVYSDGTSDLLADGFHRLAAAKQIGCNYIKCEVRSGGQRDALRWSLQANKAHGLKRSNADKRHAIRLVLADEEWGQLSANVIADMCGVTAPTVASVIEELAASARNSDSGVKVLHLPDKRIGRDGKHYPANQPQPHPVSEVSESDEDPESEHPPEADEDPEVENPADADECDTAKLDAGISPKMVAAAKGPKSKNGKPVVCSKLIVKTRANLSELSRQLHKLGIFEKHDAAVSAILRDVNAIREANAAGNRKPVPQQAPASS